MFSFAFWVISTHECEPVNFPEFELVGIPVRPFEYLGMPISLRACALCTCKHNMHAHHDITRFTYDASYVTVTSPAFVFHSFQIGMWWHGFISVHIVGTHVIMVHITWDDIGMASLCSHCIHIVLTMPSCSDHDIIVT